MNTLLFTLEYPPFKGGVANYYGNIVKHWPDDNIFVLDNNKEDLIDSKKLIKWYPAIAKLEKQIKKNKINHVLVGNILPLGTVVFLLLKKLKFDYSVFLHGTDLMYAQKSFRKKYLAKIILKNSKYVICNSDYTAGLVEEFGINKEKIRIIYPSIDTSMQADENIKKQIIQKYNLENKKILFSVGRLIKRKGVDKIIEIMPALLEDNSDIVYGFGGAGEDKEYLLAKIKALPKDIQEKIFYLGKITDQEKNAWLDLCDIFVQPTREENGNFDGFGIVYLEANFFGKPVVAGKSGGVVDAVLDNETGLLVDPADNKQIKQAILKLINNPELAQKIGKIGQKRAKNEFNWDRQVNKFIKLESS